MVKAFQPHELREKEVWACLTTGPGAAANVLYPTVILQG